jgi:hypothetical protein
MSSDNGYEEAHNSGRIGKTEGEYSVCQFFPDGQYEYTRRWVSAEEAMEAFTHYATCVTARIGITQRVIITDGGDQINYEWVYGKGLVYPVSEK